MGREVAAAAAGPVELVLIHGAGHNDTYDVGGRSYRDKMWRFIGPAGPQITPPRTNPAPVGPKRRPPPSHGRGTNPPAPSPHLPLCATPPGAPRPHDRP